jgi:mannose/fructose/N-acetylgalactosamine-specific phosphotransferase system component IID
VNKPDTTPPDPLIPKEEMINILTDIYLTEGAIAYHRLQNKDKKFLEEISPVYYKEIFDKYDIDHKILKENLNYYNSDPKTMESILEKVLENLSRLQSEVETNGPVTDTLSITEVDTAKMIIDTLNETTLPDTLEVNADSLTK